jgi:hypothetical protein
MQNLRRVETDLDFPKRHSLMTRAILFGALALSLGIMILSCGSSSHLQSIALTAASPAAVGFDVIGLGGTLQLVATGTYSDGKTKVLTDQVSFAISITSNSTDQNGAALPTSPQGLELGPTGLLTAEYPAICTWVNINASSSTATMPAWALTGSYAVTASDHGITSPPVYVAVASAVGIVDPSNPTGACGPQTTP